MSFGVSVDLLKDVLPIAESLNAETVRNYLHKTARRMEGELADEQFFFIETCPRDRTAMSLPEGRITVGIDGGYVRSRDKRQPHFEVMVAKSMPTDRPNRYLGLVHTHDTRPKRPPARGSEGTGMAGKSGRHLPDRRRRYGPEHGAIHGPGVRASTGLVPHHHAHHRHAPVRQGTEPSQSG